MFYYTSYNYTTHLPISSEYSETEVPQGQSINNKGATMAGAKLAITGTENVGKTHLISQLTDALVMSTDNKAFKGKIPHFRYNEYTGVEDFSQIINDKLEAYKKKMGNYPKTLVVDSITHLQTNMERWANNKFTGFQIWSNLGKEIIEINDFFEELIEGGLNVVLTVHVQYDADTAKYKTTSPGQFGKNGGWISVTDESIFIEVKGNKRILHFKTLKFPCRTLQPTVPTSIDMEQFNINEHIQLLEEAAGESEEWSI